MDRTLNEYKDCFREAISEIEKEVPFYSDRDFDDIISSAKRRILKRHRVSLVAAVFSIFLLGSFIFGGISYYNTLQAKQVIESSTSELVDSVLNKPFMANVEYSYISEKQSIADWLENFESSDFPGGNEVFFDFYSF